MADTSSDAGMGPDVPATTTRSTRRTRRLAIIGAVALVVVAGAVLGGAQVTGSRSGTTVPDLVGTVSCTKGGSTTFAPLDGANWVTFTWLDQYGTVKGGPVSAVKSGGTWSATTVDSVGLKVAWGTLSYLTVSKTYGTICYH